ncbi:MAG TPA: oligosaccharide flippase family protein [Blastocatellia bacterium]|nr:oligosaccharide flippase family protein [Blastocatellia bacterium]
MVGSSASRKVTDRPAPTTPLLYTAGMTTRVVRGGLWNLGGQGVTLLASFLATPFTVRLLGAEAYGVLAVINTLIAYIWFSDLGVGTASTRFGAEAHARNDDEGEAAVVWTSLLVGFVPTALAALALALAAGPMVEHALRLPAHLHWEATIALQLATLGYVARAIAGVLNTPQLVRLRQDLYTLVTAGTATAQVVLVPIALLLGGGLIAAAGVIAGVSVATIFIHAAISSRLQPRLLRPRIDTTLLSPIIRFGGGVVISALASVILANSERLLLARYASASAVAYYAVAFTLASLLTAVPQAMSQSLLPAFSGLQAASRREQLQQLYTRAIRGNLLVIAPAAFMLCILAEPFFTLWAGPEYGRESVWPFYVLAAGVVLNTLEIIPYILLIALGKSDLLARLYLIELLPYLLCAALLVAWFGAVGAALAWSLRILIETPFMILAARRVSGLAFSPLPAGRFGYILAVIALLLPAVLFSAVTSSLPLQIGVGIASLLIYGSLIWTQVLTREERAWVNSVRQFR